jgi:hypothetical protein
MKTNGMVRWIGLAVCGWAVAEFAQELPEPVVVTVLGTNYTAKELGVEAGSPPDLLLTRTLMKIQGGIMGAYAEKLNYQPSEEELREFCRRSAPTAEDMKSIIGSITAMSSEDIFEATWQDWQREADDPYGMMSTSAKQLQEWKFNKTLFDQYGGRVLVDQWGPQAYEAAHAYLAERESAGDFAIHDADLRQRYWALIRTLPPVPTVSEEEGRAALTEHPADRLKRETEKGLREHLGRSRAPTPE